MLLKPEPEVEEVKMYFKIATRNAARHAAFCSPAWVYILLGSSHVTMSNM